MPLIADLKVWADLEILTATDLNAALAEIRTTVNSFVAFKDQANTFTQAQTFGSTVAITGAVTCAAGVTVTGTAAATTFSGSGASLTNLPAASLTGTIDGARFPATLPAASGENLTALPAANLTGTLPNGVFPATLPAASAANLTNIPAANITGTLPAISGANLTSLNASNVSSGTLNVARLPSDITGRNVVRSSSFAGTSGTTAALTMDGSFDAVLEVPSSSVNYRKANNGSPNNWAITGPLSLTTYNSGQDDIFLVVKSGGVDYYLRLERWTA